MIVPKNPVLVTAEFFLVAELVSRSTYGKSMVIPLHTKLQAQAVIAPKKEKKVGYSC